MEVCSSPNPGLERQVDGSCEGIYQSELGYSEYGSREDYCRSGQLSDQSAPEGKETQTRLVPAGSVQFGRINAAKADVIIEWEGNAYGEIGTPVIRRELKTSTDWSKSS